jgi:hypothetical protein
MNRTHELDSILHKYSSSFSSKVYSEENEDYDILMKVFGITPSIKRENKQYWGERIRKVLGSISCRSMQIQ